MSDYVIPSSLDEALGRLQQDRWSVLAGGTDIFPAHVEKPISGKILDISVLAELRGIDKTSDGWRIGALTTWTDIVKAELPSAFNGLKLAAREIGGWQIQNVATIGGNLCNASPAADGVPPLLTLDAQVELASTKGYRTLPVAEFISGNRQTLKRTDELLIAVLIPHQSAQARSHFRKLGARTYLVISIAMVAVFIDIDVDERITTARVAIGACSPVAQRLTALEQALTGRPGVAEVVDLVTAKQLLSLRPIDDIRATAAYRSAAAVQLIRSALKTCLSSS